MIETRFCTTIDRPPLFFWLEVDELGVFIFFIVLSFLAFRQATQGAITGVVAVWAYKKFFKSKGGTKKLMHFFWRLGLISYPFLPSGHTKYFWE